MPEFAPIPGYSDYAADVNGNIYTRRPKGGHKICPYGTASGPYRVMKPEKMPGDYLRVRLGADGAPKRVGVMVHRVIAYTYLGMRPDGYVIAHLNGNPKDNRVSNLAYVTPAENKRHEIIHGTRYEGDRHHARTIKKTAWIHIVERIAQGESKTALAREYGVSRQLIARRLKEHEMKEAKIDNHTGTITHA